MDPLDKLSETFSLDELRAEKAELDAEIAVRARRASQLERLIALLTEVGDGEPSPAESRAEDARIVEEGGRTVVVEAKAHAPRPPLDEAILQIMREWDPSTIWRGDKILIHLNRKDWAPGGKTPRNTVDATLSRLTQQRRLERVGRGVYKLAPESEYQVPEPGDPLFREPAPEDVAPRASAAQ